MNSFTRTTHHRPTARAPRLVAAALLCVGATMSVVAGPANANTDQVCGPLTSGKIDTAGNPKTITITLSDEDIAAGKVITGYCVKAGSAEQTDGGPVYVTLDPPVTTITFGHPSGKDVSHYSYSVAASTPPTTSTTPTSTETPVPTETPSTPAENEVLGEQASGNNGGNTNGGNNNGGTNNGGNSNGGGNSPDNNDAEVLGEQAFANNAPAAQQSAPASPAVQVPTVINAGNAGAAPASPVAPAAIALFGTLMALASIGMRRRSARMGADQA
ncbi:MAG TPA: hypothetical protein VGV65_04270 [Nocardioides sp.]|nr:hypothetical protein [Nocardioides sp.]